MHFSNPAIVRKLSIDSYREIISKNLRRFSSQRIPQNVRIGREIFQSKVHELIKKENWNKLQQLIQSEEQIRGPFDDHTILRTIHELSKNGYPHKAKFLLHRLDNSSKSVRIEAHNFVLKGHDKSYKDVNKHLRQMEAKNLASNYSYAILISSLSEVGIQMNLFQVLSRMKRLSLQPEFYHFNALIHLSAKFGDLQLALRLFEKMKVEGIRPDSKTYGALLNGCSKSADYKCALELFGQLKSSQKTVVNWTSLLKTLAGAKQYQLMFEKLAEMKAGGVQPNVITFSEVMTSAVKNDDAQIVEKVFELMMIEGVLPNLYIYNILMQGKVNSSSIEEAELLLENMLDRGIKPDRVSFKTLFSAFHKAGNLDKTMHWFGFMCDTGVRYSETDVEWIIEEMTKNGRLADADAVFSQALNAKVLSPFIEEGEVEVIDAYCFRSAVALAAVRNRIGSKVAARFLQLEMKNRDGGSLSAVESYLRGMGAEFVKIHSKSVVKLKFPYPNG